MKKEKHPVYRFILGGFILLLLLGVALLVIALLLGPDRFASPRMMSV